MLSHLSWTSYLEIVVSLLIVYYAYILLRYYREELINILPNGRRQHYNSNPLAALSENEPLLSEVAENPLRSSSNPDNQPDDSLAESDDLIRQLKQCIQVASEKPFSPAPLVTQLKKIVQTGTSLQHSPHRPAINELIVAECERTGTALLTEEEVDQWWRD